jgi:hypothetical protein
VTCNLQKTEGNFTFSYTENKKDESLKTQGRDIQSKGGSDFSGVPTLQD